MTDKEILQKWCATYGENDEDIRATMWGEDLMIEFAKQYHKEQLILTDVSHRRELLIDFAEKVYRSIYFTWDKKTSEKVVDEYIKGNL